MPRLSSWPQWPLGTPLVEGTSEAFLAASAPRVAHMLYHHPEPGPTWQQSAQRAARLEPGRRRQQTRFIKHHERHTWQQSCARNGVLC
jgi:hypothetical protein